MPSTEQSSHTRRGRRGRKKGKREGFALLLALIAIAILSILVTDLHETTGMALSAAVAERDQLRAEYLAKSGINLTRMLIGQERNLRQLLAGPYQLMLKRPPPQLPVWKFADALLSPFANYEASKADVSEAGVDVGKIEGLGDVHGTFEVRAAVENGKVNVNDPRMQDQATSQAHVGVQLYGLIGGYAPSPNKYDPLFSKLDDQGQIVSRLDLISNIVDWWDLDEQRAKYDPVMFTSSSSGSEENSFYQKQTEPYAIKNAPFDTLEEVRLVRGMTDDVWATFVEPDVDDPNARQLSIYGTQRINPNEAEPSLILSRLCTFAEARNQPLCADPQGVEALKFINLLSTARMLASGVPWFSRSTDFMNFVTGKPDSLYSMLQSMLGGGAGGGSGSGTGAAAGAAALGGGAQSSTLLFTPLVIAEEWVLKSMRSAFSTSGNVFTIEVTGRAGNAQRRIRAVINTDPKWTPPPPNAGKLPPLGVFAYYRLD
jgi:general secretion pathway protein K